VYTSSSVNSCIFPDTKQRLFLLLSLCYTDFMAEETKKKKSLQVELLRQMVTLSTSGFGLVAALAWNNVIQEFVNGYVKKFLPEGSGLTTLFIYAIVITALAVLVTYQLSKVLDRLDP